MTFGPILLLLQLHTASHIGMQILNFVVSSVIIAPHNALYLLSKTTPLHEGIHLPNAVQSK